jgi:hypothetical protein
VVPSLLNKPDPCCRDIPSKFHSYTLGQYVSSLMEQRKRTRFTGLYLDHWLQSMSSHSFMSLRPIWASSSHLLLRVFQVIASAVAFWQNFSKHFSCTPCLIHVILIYFIALTVRGEEQAHISQISTNHVYWTVSLGPFRQSTRLKQFFQAHYEQVNILTKFIRTPQANFMDNTFLWQANSRPNSQQIPRPL